MVELGLRSRHSSSARTSPLSGPLESRLGSPDRRRRAARVRPFDPPEPLAPRPCTSRAPVVRDRPGWDRNTVDSPVAPYTETSDAPAVGRHLEDDELDECRPPKDEHERCPPFSVRSAVSDPVTSETEPGGLFPARLGPPSLIGLVGAPADPRRSGVALRPGWRRLQGRRRHVRDPRRPRSLRWNRQRRRRYRGRRHDRRCHRRDGHRGDGHRRERQRGQRDRRRGKQRQCGSGSGPACGQRDDHQGAPDGAAPHHGFQLGHFSRPDAPGDRTCGLPRLNGGGEIRTHGPREGPTVFKTAPFDRSGTPPDGHPSRRAPLVTLCY